MAVEEVDPNGIPGLNPTADGRPLRAMYLPEGSIDSHRLIQALTRRAERTADWCLTASSIAYRVRSEISFRSGANG